MFRLKRTIRPGRNILMIGKTKLQILSVGKSAVYLGIEPEEGVNIVRGERAGVESSKAETDRCADWGLYSEEDNQKCDDMVTRVKQQILDGELESYAAVVDAVKGTLSGLSGGTDTVVKESVLGYLENIMEEVGIVVDKASRSLAYGW